MSPKADILEPAAPEDADAVYSLLTEAFGESFLRFTVYQSSRALGFLREQIADSLGRAQPSVFVLRGENALDGFYAAVDRHGEFFLSYIATRPTERGRGAGRLLLDHFEATGKSRGCTSLGLEVFRSNVATEAWYRRRGYIACGSRFRARFELADFSAAPDPGLAIGPRVLDRALDDEEHRGFASLHGVSAGRPIRLGFIGGTVCNLMEPSGAEGIAVAPALARRFGACRRWLLAVGSEAFAGEPRPESQQEALYMRKAIDRTDQDGGLS